MEECRRCFSIVIYGCCSRSALYSARLSFITIFLLTTFDTKNLFQLKSQPGVAYKNVSFKKWCNIVLKPSKHEELKLFLRVLSQKNVAKSNPVRIYLFTFNNRSARKMCETCSKLTIKTPERRLDYFPGDSNLSLFDVWQNRHS